MGKQVADLGMGRDFYGKRNEEKRHKIRHVQEPEGGPTMSTIVTLLTTVTFGRFALGFWKFPLQSMFIGVTGSSVLLGGMYQSNKIRV